MVSGAQKMTLIHVQKFVHKCGLINEYKYPIAGKN